MDISIIRIVYMHRSLLINFILEVCFKFVMKLHMKKTLISSSLFSFHCISNVLLSRIKKQQINSKNEINNILFSSPTNKRYPVTSAE